jgi:putative redox protein
MISAKDAVLVEETGAGRYQVRASSGDHQLIIDEPIAYGGLGSGPNPFDLLCMALGSCSVITMRFYAERKGWTLGPFSARVVHRKGGSQARDRFERELFLGPVTPEQQERLLAIADKCPVHLLLEGGADVVTSLATSHLADGQAEGLHPQVVDELCREAS